MIFDSEKECDPDIIIVSKRNPTKKICAHSCDGSLRRRTRQPDVRDRDELLVFVELAISDWKAEEWRPVRKNACKILFAIAA